MQTSFDNLVHSTAIVPTLAEMMETAERLKKAAETTPNRAIVSRCICERPLLGQMRTHRKSRINKKWRKRYGMKFGPCPGKCFQVSRMIVMCPHVHAQVKDLPEMQALLDPMAGLPILTPRFIATSAV